MERQATPPPVPPGFFEPPPEPRRWLRPPRFRRSLALSAALHGTLVAAAVVLGLGPRPADGRVWFTSSLAFAEAESSEPAPTPGVEPNRLPDVPEPPEPELVPVEPAAAAEPRQEPPPAPERLEPVDTTHIWASLSLDPFTPPEIEETSSLDVAAGAQPEQTEPTAEMEPQRTGVVVVRAPAPAYPRAAVRLGQEGAVVVRIQVSARGEVLDVQVAESSGYSRLDEAALETVRGWSFRAATEAGVPVAGTLLHRVVFRIEDAAM